MRLSCRMSIWVSRKNFHFLVRQWWPPNIDVYNLIFSQAPAVLWPSGHLQSSLLHRNCFCFPNLLSSHLHCPPPLLVPPRWMENCKQVSRILRPLSVLDSSEQQQSILLSIHALHINVHYRWFFHFSLSLSNLFIPAEDYYQPEQQFQLFWLVANIILVSIAASRLYAGKTFFKEIAILLYFL